MIGPPIGVGPGTSAQASPCIKAALDMGHRQWECIIKRLCWWMCKALSGQLLMLIAMTLEKPFLVKMWSLYILSRMFGKQKQNSASLTNSLSMVSHHTSWGQHLRPDTKETLQESPNLWASSDTTTLTRHLSLFCWIPKNSSVFFFQKFGNKEGDFMALFHRQYLLISPRLSQPFFAFRSPKWGTWYFLVSPPSRFQESWSDTFVRRKEGAGHW